MNLFKRFFGISIVILFLLFWFLGELGLGIRSVYASASVTTATGGSAISADTTGGSYTTLSGPTITEGANRDVPASGTVILSAPSGFIFNTGVTVTATITRDVGTGTCFTFSSTTATPTASTITYTLTARDSKTDTKCHVTFSNIQVRPSSGTPLASGNITHTGTASITGITSSTNLGTLTEVVGAKNKLAVTTQPSSSAAANTDFATKPIVKLQDQFGNTVTTDSSSTITRAVVLSTQSCGGTAGSGSLTSTPASGTAVSSGVLTYTAMQYSAAESIKICFSSTGVTSALSNTIIVIGLPTVTTQAATNVKDTTATANGNITLSGGENADKQGFVYDTSTKSLPGNVAPGSSGYASFTESTGSFATGAFTISLTGLTGGNTYYGRAYAHNSAGYSYGSEVNFATAAISITITSSGVISYGIIPANTSKDTTSSGLNTTQTARNASTIAEDFNIKGQNSANWTLTPSTGANQYIHKFSTNGGSSWIALTTSYQTLGTNIAASGTQTFDLQITTPASSSTFVQQSVDVTIQAVAH